MSKEDRHTKGKDSNDTYFHLSKDEPFNAGNLTEGDLLPGICFALANLDRFARHYDCSHQDRTTIYELKSAFIEYLYTNDYCIAAKMVQLNTDHRTCFTCYGTGQRFGHLCQDCHGSGIYSYGGPLYVYVLSFEVLGTCYTWRQPDYAIDYSIELINSDDDVLNGPEVEQLEMPKKDLPVAFAALRYFVETFCRQ